MPGLRVQDLEIPWAAAVCQAVLPEPPEGLGCRSAAEVADTVQAGEAEAAEVDEQVLHGEDAQLPARPDDALRQAEGVERGVEQAAEPARSAGLAPLLRHVLVDGGDPVAAEQGGKGCAVDHQDAVETGVGDVVAVHPEGDAQLVRAAEPGGFRHGDPTDAVHRLRSFPLGLSVRGGNPYTVRKSLSKVRYASKGLPSLLLNPLIRDVLPLVTRSAIWLSVSCFSPLLRKTVSPQSTLLHLATFG